MTWRAPAWASNWPWNPGEPKTWRPILSRAKKAQLLRQYNDCCGICGEAIDSTLGRPDPLAFTIDHIVPRAAGGGNEIENLQPAHYACNAAKGNSLPQ